METFPIYVLKDMVSGGIAGERITARPLHARKIGAIERALWHPGPLSSWHRAVGIEAATQLNGDIKFSVVRLFPSVLNQVRLRRPSLAMKTIRIFPA
jgi:hypothetical protein